MSTEEKVARVKRARERFGLAAALEVLELSRLRPAASFSPMKRLTTFSSGACCSVAPATVKTRKACAPTGKAVLWRVPPMPASSRIVGRIVFLFLSPVLFLPSGSPRGHAVDYLNKRETDG